MIRTLSAFLLTFFLAAIPTFCAAQPPIAGEWIGGYAMNGRWTLLALHVAGNSTGLAATLNLPALGIAAKPITDLALKSTNVQWRISLGKAELKFDGRLEADQIRGAVIVGNQQGRFQLLRTSVVDRSSLAQYQGAYEWTSHRFVYLQFWDELGKNQLGMFDESGQVRSLYPMSHDKFFVGAGLRLPVPLEAILKFHRNRRGVVTSLVWRPTRGTEQTATMAHLEKQEPVSISHGGVRLSGALIAPPAKGPHPALVIVPGSGPQDRSDSLPFVHFLVRHGFALLVYDKRGVGESTGDWKTSSFQDLADDAVAAVHFLQNRPEIDPHRVGIFGVSQGGWIGPLAAARSPDVAFVISVSGPGVTPGEETLDFLQNEMQLDGLSHDDIAEARELTQLYFNYARTGAHWESYFAARQKSRSKPWFRFMDLPDDKNSWQREFWRLNVDYDPTPALQKMRCPVLAFFGGLDLNVVADKNLPIWNTALRKSGNSDYLLVVVGNGNHILVQSRTGSIFEFPHLQSFSPDYSRVLLGWLNATMKVISGEKAHAKVHTPMAARRQTPEE